MFLLINKPAGITSHDVIDRVRAITSERTVGHAGTLDPFATGLLIVGVGRAATKQLHRFLKLDKRYRATVHFGATSNTQDVTGNITEHIARAETSKIPHPDYIGIRDDILNPSRGDVLHTLEHFIGDIQQIPPMYSAKKIGGKKLYELARAGIAIERPPHAITIHSISLISYEWPRAVIDVHCSSGTYIRTLCADIGERLGVGAYCETLERTAIGPYSLSDAVDLDALTAEHWHVYKKDLA